MYQLKQELEDFIVKEQLPFEPDGKGDFLYLFFEKKWINTMYIVNRLCNELDLQRYDIWIAGLKDKHGITQQRISIGKRTLEKIWGEKKFIESLKEDVEILKTTRHKDLLKVGMNMGNDFEIRLRASQEIPSKAKHLIKKKLNTIKHEGMPNFFGIQRFGKGYRNVRRAEKFLESKGNEDKHMKFNLQAYASYHFNEFLTQRLQMDELLIEGDICMNKHNAKSEVGYFDGEKIQLFDYRKCKEKYEARDFFYPDCLGDKIEYSEEWIPSGPIIGRNILIPLHESPAWKFERDFLKNLNLFQIDIFNKFQLYGLRRPLRAYPKNLDREFEANDDLILKFFLPTGSYATVLLEAIL